MAKFGFNVNRIRIRIQNMQKSRICKENTTKEIPGLKPFQNEKLEKELNDFQSVLIVSFYPLFLNKLGSISKKWVKGQLILGVTFSFLAIIVTDTAFAF